MADRCPARVFNGFRHTTYAWLTTGRISPTMMNHVTAGYGRQINPSTSKHVGENGAQALGISGFAGFNYPEIAGLTRRPREFPDSRLPGQ